MAIATITAAYEIGVKRFLYLGSTCIYPRMAPQPIREEYLLTSPLEETNEAYALAKIVGLKLCQYYRKQYGVVFHSAMPTNLYGTGDNYHPNHSHVIPGLIRRFHEAKINGAETISIWGTGKPRREFLYVDDLADALLHLISIHNPPDWVNVGSSTDISILELANLVAETVGYEGGIRTDSSKPDGTPRKLTDNSLLRSTGWSPTITLADGLKLAYADFLMHLATGTLRSQ
jgi:GDP-L-fucose synthase